MIETIEYDGDPSNWVCRCGNTPLMFGFFPCALDGQEVEPDPEHWPLPLFACDSCGRIIDYPSGCYVGQRHPELEQAPKQLPTFDGYTVDLRLREFRKVPQEGLPEFIDFGSPEGHALLNRLHEELVSGMWRFAYIPLAER